jgi:hypothetical protein
MTFGHPYFLLLELLLPLLAWLKGRRGSPPAFLYSSVKLVAGLAQAGDPGREIFWRRCAGWPWPCLFSPWPTALFQKHHRSQSQRH